MATDSSITVPSSRTSVGSRPRGLMARKSSPRFSPPMMSTCWFSQVTPFSAMNMRTRRGFGAILLS